ncbi:MAG: hypothetical protein CL554_20165 [Algoriphagus sp.]|uniref:carbamoyltransferase C-terminal domain-containing protein n=1 Tax=Algoriphagus sp. TaxID=1872435 RepID=UPI000C509B92|nr:carbamoyltransferase C-terminal domain-containing protein [Algoriphagus sp.]MAL15725.1 hypothetical protein [Algoriphagus sp.]
MKILGVSTGHDCSYCLLEDGKPVIHEEWERFSRVKESDTNVFEFAASGIEDFNDIKYVTHWPCNTAGWENLFKHDKLQSYRDMKAMVNKNGGGYYQFGHHQSHAANAFFSSNFDQALIFTLDAGGWDYTSYDSNLIGVDKMIATSITVWRGNQSKISPVAIIPIDDLSIGLVWHDILPPVFGLSNGTPIGNQAGTVMAMAAMGKTKKYFNDIGFSNRHNRTNFSGLATAAKQSPQEPFEIAYALQAKTEMQIQKIISEHIKPGDENLCFVGGVALNCVSMGKIYDWFPQVKEVYVPPVPYDAGLSIGSAQYLYHHVMDNPRVKWDNNFTPYLGRKYSEDDVLSALTKNQEHLTFSHVEDEAVINLLGEELIVSVFGGGSESGRRALGNRSILADPRSKNMKDIINQKVKHRQDFRPFAPSILKEEVKNWFVRDVDSPYMNFAIEFQDHAKSKTPAVVHFNNTGRLQTVTEKDNKWYYNFIKKWHASSGVPILLNTSFNDREPIVETPNDAIKCFLKTNIDNLYFTDYGILVSKK